MSSRPIALRFGAALISVLMLFSAAVPALAAPAAAPRPDSLADNPNPPSAPVKLIFIHHSTGSNWLADGDGGLGIALRDNNYFVSDTNYGWGIKIFDTADGNNDQIGDYTDIGMWWTWFRGTRRDEIMEDVYTESEKHSDYLRLGTDPGGENQIILFKSCFPNSNLGGSPGDPATTGDNPLRGQGAGSSQHTVGNAKGIYNDILQYFGEHPEKLFVVITAPPLISSDRTPDGANARAFNNWLVDKENGWLAGYTLQNVAVFDFYNVLTSNGGNANTNDLNSASGNHHRWWNGAVQHQVGTANNMASYPTSDDHPSAAGNRKATAEFVQLLNVFYHRWADNSAPPTAPANLTGSPASMTRINLSWTDSSGESGYYVERMEDGVNWVQIDTLPADTAVYSNHPLTCGKNYRYRVTAFNGAGTATTETGNLQTRACSSAPLPPTSISGQSISIYRIKLTWSDVVDDETAYVLERYAVGSGWVVVSNLAADVTTFTDSGLQPNTTYQYRLRAHNGNGDSPYVTLSAATFSTGRFVPLVFTPGSVLK